MSSTDATTDRRSSRRPREGPVVRSPRLAALRKSALLSVILLWCLFPFFWLIMTSLKTEDRALNSPDLFQGPFGFENYRNIFTRREGGARQPGLGEPGHMASGPQ